MLVAQLCLNLCNPTDHNLPVSSVHRIFQARILEWVAISFSRGSSWPRDQTWASYISGRYFTIWATRQALHRLHKKWYETQIQFVQVWMSYYWVVGWIETVVSSLPFPMSCLLLGSSGSRRTSPGNWGCLQEGEPGFSLSQDADWVTDTLRPTKVLPPKQKRVRKLLGGWHMIPSLEVAGGGGHMWTQRALSGHPEGGSLRSSRQQQGKEKKQQKISDSTI